MKECENVLQNNATTIHTEKFILVFLKACFIFNLWILIVHLRFLNNYSFNDALPVIYSKLQTAAI